MSSSSANGESCSTCDYGYFCEWRDGEPDQICSAHTKTKMVSVQNGETEKHFRRPVVPQMVSMTNGERQKW